MDKFFIIGMPRSRTLWMSMLMSLGDSICYHEQLTAFMGEKNPEYLDNLTVDYCGFSDTNPVNFKNVRTGNSPVLIIRREKDYVLESCLECFDNPFHEGEAFHDLWKKIYPSSTRYDITCGMRIFERFLWEILTRYESELDKLEKKLNNVKIVSFSDLDSVANIILIMEYLTPGHKVSEYHMEKMQDTKIVTKNRSLVMAVHDISSFYKKEPLDFVMSVIFNGYNHE